MNKKDKIQLAITGVLIIILIILLIGSFRGKKHPKAVPIVKKNEPSQSQTADKNIKKSEDMYAKLEEESKRLELKRDPFSRQPKIASGPYLSGIVWDKEHPTAIINDTIVGISEEVMGHRVIDIQKDRVILFNGTKSVVLNLEVE